jgi:hypothetical protein
MHYSILFVPYSLSTTPAGNLQSGGLGLCSFSLLLRGRYPAMDSMKGDDLTAAI